MNDRDDWQKTLKIAVNRLRNAHIPDSAWVFGGGTLLRWYYDHRVSNDIDIFFHDAQYLGFMSPRLNDEMLEDVTGYTEESIALTLQLKQGKIDFVVAANLTGLLPSVIQINDMEFYAEQPEEVIVKKMFYRADTFRMRDVIDTAVVLRDKEASLAPLVKRICSSKIDIILDRINDPEISVEKIELLDKTISKEASMKSLREFFAGIKNKKLFFHSQEERSREE